MAGITLKVKGGIQESKLLCEGGEIGVKGDSPFLLILPIPHQPLRISSECGHIANKIRACCRSQPEKGKGWPGWGPGTFAREGLEQITAVAA